ncbi:MAG: thymidine phosphorylase [candidate division KSB1 bacterium]|nr:thymidine phosphorylase [candidate division KSB1 bacterium]
MELSVRDILAKKRDGSELSCEEIETLIAGYCKGSVPDYQMAAFLMAVTLRGMTVRETRCLTTAMLSSGRRADFSALGRPCVDKHSTGGVGDKVSLILAPLVAACGATVPMISGRSLEHTGGTLDKLASIPGFRTDLRFAEFVRQVERIGVAIAGQTEEMVPADRKIYALRDATATVASVPLAVASILSKKLAEGAQHLVLDVKVGSGAFFRTQEEARTLAHLAVSVGCELGLPVRALLTDMDQPLGRAAGNWVEVREAAETLRGHGPEDLVEIVLALGREMLEMSGVCEGEEAERRLRRNLEDGTAWRKFLALVEAQGGDVSVVENPDRHRVPRHTRTVSCPAAGFVTRVDAYWIGRAAAWLGAGRTRPEEETDPQAGVLLLKVAGDKVEAGEPVAVLTTDSHPERLEMAAELVRRAFVTGEEPLPRRGMVLERIL